MGDLVWDFKKKGDLYELNVTLNSKGLLSKLFYFKGGYSSKGRIINGEFIATNYSQKWETNKKKRYIDISFKKNKVLKIKQNPKEQETARINLVDLEGYSDPLTSFLKLLSGLYESKTIDGRRLYTLKISEESKNNNKKIYNVKNFTNLWADHKRNDLKNISIVIGVNNYAPEAIFINFKGRLFKVLAK